MFIIILIQLSAKKYRRITKESYGSKVQTGIPSLIKNGVVHTSSVGKCNIFNSTFTDKAKLPAIKLALLPLVIKNEQRIEVIQRSEEDVKKILKNLSIYKVEQT